RARHCRIKRQNRGTDIKEAMTAVLKKRNMSFEKPIVTDGAPSMIGSVNGLVGLCKGDDAFPEFWNFHCIIHREQLVSKTLNLDQRYEACDGDCELHPAHP
ncbi:hypothetical protein JRQ81_017583, partial [Phrynocephalus forsythii]